MSERYAFTPEEWRTLQFAPFWMLSAVVGAYRGFDPFEYEAFARSVETAALARGQLIREVAASVAMDLDRLAEQYRADRRSIALGLFEVGTVLAKVPGEEAETFKEVLVSDIAEGVAKARGRFGRVMSKEDAQNVELATQLLG